MPSANGFTAVISVENTESKKGDISIKIFGVGAGGSKEFLCKITQSQKITCTPVDLVIPAKAKLTRWENAEGDFFYTCHIINISRRIVGKIAKNPYEDESGYEIITQMEGVVDRYDTSFSHEPHSASEELKEKTKIDLKVNLGVVLSSPEIKLNGVAFVINKFKISYTLPPGFKYVAYVENSNNFQHLWAYRS